MTHRERTSRRTSAGGAAAVLEPPRPAPPADTPISSFEDLGRLASEAQRDDFLAFARAHGFLYRHQLPLEASCRPAAGDPITQWNRLNHLLAGDADFDPVPDAGFEPVDQMLDAQQRQGVARALSTPDLAAIVGWPGTGKSRVVAEILTQAALRNERVLFVAAHAAPVDHVLAQLAGRDALCPVRLLESAESPEGLSPAVRALTLPQRLQDLKQQVLANARRCQQAAASAERQRREEEALWPRLQHLVEPGEGVQEQLQEVERRRSQVPAEVEAESVAALGAGGAARVSRFAREVHASQRRHTEALSECQQRRDLAEQERARAVRALEALGQACVVLQPLAEAKRRGRWWTWTWWRATLRGKVRVRLAELESKRQTAAQTRASADQELQRLAKQREELERDHVARLERLRKEEIKRREQGLAGETEPLALAYQKLEQQWRQLASRLPEAVRPATISTGDLDVARLAWQELLRRDESRRAFIQEWTASLQRLGRALDEPLLSLVNLVAGTTQAVAEDRHFAAQSFDLLVVEAADHISEAEFLKLARRAHRWVLIGEPAWEYETPRLPPRERLAPFALLHKLWQRLHWNPRRWPAPWACEDARLCCRLRAVADEQRRWLESERVVDAPDIELRILNLPRVEPVLAEIVFPANTTLERAKQYVYRELQAVPVQGRSCNASLREEADRLVLDLGDEPVRSASSLLLEPGLRECLQALREGGGNGAHKAIPPTCRFEFERTAGWSSASVRQWARQHLGFRELGRTAWLEVPHRMHPDLADVVGPLLFGAQTPLRPPSRSGAASSEAFTLIAVPGLRGRDAGVAHHGQGKSNKSAALPRDGAGLEQDLSIPRHGDRLPTELRRHLPPRGVVNFLEAQAILRKLEDLLGRAPGANPSPGLSVAVTACSAAQVELLRLLVARSPTVLAAGRSVAVGLPRDFAEQEYDLVLIGLTRSHGHRAVALAERVHDLALAFTRARRRLIVFADLGTLVRRSQFVGRLEQLDEAASAWEAQFAARLVTYVGGKGT